MPQQLEISEDPDKLERYFLALQIAINVIDREPSTVFLHHTLNELLKDVEHLMEGRELGRGLRRGSSSRRRRNT